MTEERLYELIQEKERRASVAMPATMRKVYVWMTLALAITGFTAWMVADTGLWFTIASNRVLLWGLIIAELGMVFGISAGINRLSPAVATLLFALYSLLNGITLASIFIIYDIGSIATVFFIAAGMFAAMGVVGIVLKTALSKFGNILLMGLLGLIIASLVNVFFIKSGMMELMLSWAGVVIFAGLTMYDTQRIKQMLIDAEQPEEVTQKIALLGALCLYLDFINMFLYLLRIFGGSRD
ncbi:MAG: Bax inhibitor-1/YccA family protein [Prevotella sp.]|uniref:Bax inhibitor-1/YccA family protein n=1 Tax=Prevotella sp. TaxID=59823 RepID=UPI002A272F76|nr:Bax inhibitor-1/YccA family protein [Prevotella sp.]MDD7318542.1 Bax inhibitor-1/YccA family protein [Prevotellaceae bacterium]MDY4020343.1 Bax inhibitor-1/YccA family protein [Prevotella sp.]